MIGIRGRTNLINVVTLPGQKDKQKENQSVQNDSDDDNDNNAIQKKSFKEQKWFLQDGDVEEEVHWNKQEKYLIVNLLKNVERMCETYRLCAIQAKQLNSQWGWVQNILAALSASLAFLNASHFSGWFSNVIGWDSATVNSTMSLGVGIISVVLGMVHEIVKKREYPVLIRKFAEIRDDYIGVKLFIESEVRFHKTEAITLENKVSRILQELQVTHQSTQVPVGIDRKMPQCPDRENMEGMGRESIIEHHEWEANAQRKVRKKQINKQYGIEKPALVRVIHWFKNISKAFQEENTNDDGQEKCNQEKIFSLQELRRWEGMGNHGKKNGIFKKQYQKELQLHGVKIPAGNFYTRKDLINKLIAHYKEKHSPIGDIETQSTHAIGLIEKKIITSPIKSLLKGNLDRKVTV